MEFSIESFIQQALHEDIGPGDFTSLACINTNQKSTAKLLAKDNGIISGIEIATKIFNIVDPFLQVETYTESGKKIEKGNILLTVTGSTQSILKSERIVLNILQRMSGIATYTHQINQLIAHTQCKLLDTRKTTPNFRYFEKLAVKHGGGVNHRFGLYDMIMIKDNHVDFAGGIKEALTLTYKYLLDNHLDIKVEIETRNLTEVQQVLESGYHIDRIMLDNYPPSELTKAINLIQDFCETEASGGIDESTIKEYAETGVNFISMGALTHSYKSLDLSLKAI
ncbi:MAG TPA: carboxylating nicotinate-nucleotide diphosphorylase [Bacteroidia bacterium]|nr:carboxylating nicotinate-nucleotide diphosphorylase [Bacteroidia bacterium]